MIWLFLDVSGTIFSKKSFTKLDFLKAVSVTMIANSEKMKIEKIPSHFGSPTDFLKKFLPLPNFLENVPSPIKENE